MNGLTKPLSEGKRMPKKEVLEAIGATPETTYAEYVALLKDKVGNLKGLQITDPVPLKQIDKALKIALGLKKDTSYTDIVKMSWSEGPKRPKRRRRFK